MKNTLVWTAIFTLLGSQAFASPPPKSPNASMHYPSQGPSGVQPAAPPASPQPIPVDNRQPQHLDQSQPTPTVNTVTPTDAVLNCNYKIPPQTKAIDQTLVSNWAQKAIVQAFTFSPTALDSQLQNLQACFTDQGWAGFNAALQKSGNLEAIKSQNLVVTSQIQGQPMVTEANNNQWRINLPLVVIYQNDKEKVSQLLSVDLTVGRKMTGELGITQMIAAPRGTVTNNSPQAPTPNPEAVNLDTQTGSSENPAATTQQP